jgi:hypothetical protein
MPVRVSDLWRKVEQDVAQDDPLAVLEWERKRLRDARAKAGVSHVAPDPQSQLGRIEKAMWGYIKPRWLASLERYFGGVPATGAGDATATSPQARRHLRSKASPQKMSKEAWLTEVAELSRQHGIKTGQEWDAVFASRPGFPSRKRVSAWLTELHGELVDGERVWPQDRGRGRSKQWDWMLRNL